MKGRPIIKNECSGYASNDGNGMVGGRWYGCDRLAYRGEYISQHIDIDKVSDTDAVCDWLEKNHLDFVTIECYIEFDDDFSTNHHSVTISELFYPEEFDERINKCPHLTDEEKKKTIAAFKEYVEGLEETDFRLYEIDDDPDYDYED